MINLRRINLNLLTFFEALYQERNLTAAAERVSVSQPAMSNALARLRAAFNDELFVRVGNSMEPTPRARRLAPSVLDALSKVREGLLDNNEFDPSVEREFNIAGVDHISLYAIPEILRRNPEILRNIRFNALHISNLHFAERLRSGALDLMVDVAEYDNDEFQSKLLLHEELVPVVRKGHPLEGSTLSMQDLKSLRIVIFASRENTALMRLEQFLRSNDLEHTIAVRLNEAIAINEMVKNTDLVGFIPRTAAKRRADDVSILDAPFPRKIVVTHYMIWHRLQDDDPGNCWLRDQLSAVYQRPFSLPEG